MNLVNKVELAAATGLASLSLLLSGCGNVANQYQSVEVLQTPIRGETGNSNYRNLRMIEVTRDNSGETYEVWLYEDENGKTHKEYLPRSKIN